MDSATVTIRVDGIALEQDETFQLRLVANSPPAGIFCLDTLDFVIEDGNGINIMHDLLLLILFLLLMMRMQFVHVHPWLR